MEETKQSRKGKGKVDEECEEGSLSTMDAEPKFIIRKKPKYIHKGTHFTVREYEDPKNKKGVPLFLGLPSVTLASILATGYLREQLKLPCIGSIDSKDLGLRCIIEEGTPSFPIRIYGSDKAYIILSEFQLKSTALSEEFIDVVFDFAKRHKCGAIYVFDGIPLSKAEAQHMVISKDSLNSKLQYLTTSPIFAQIMHAEGYKPVDTAVVNGLGARLIAKGMVYGEEDEGETDEEEESDNELFDISCIFAPVISNLPDASSALHIVGIMNQIYPDFQVDTQSLEKTTEKFDAGITKFIQKERQPSAAALSMFN